MKLFAVAILFGVLMTTVTAGFSSMFTSSSRSDIDIDAALSNDEYVTAFIHCLLDKGSCSPEGQKVKDLLPEALASHCEHCKESNKKMARTAIKHVMKHKPSEWEEIKAKYDPNGAHHDDFQKFLEGS